MKLTTRSIQVDLKKCRKSTLTIRQRKTDRPTQKSDFIRAGSEFSSSNNGDSYKLQFVEDWTRWLKPIRGTATGRPT
ncbi:hypothetical protein GWI33_002918 [Rhynchophorus ferrugineus]|uniref:Uncharacterized protein n=1 Tax=Rhynchophorus ferrugineus TaxID=354439 RepID=A0A834MFB0_RHYFE|nr:hypothetical protein GWI33_002918 [Rhynchophorus ferrugineus]